MGAGIQITLYTMMAYIIITTEERTTGLLVLLMGIIIAVSVIEGG